MPRSLKTTRLLTTLIVGGLTAVALAKPAAGQNSEPQISGEAAQEQPRPQSLKLQTDFNLAKKSQAFFFDPPELIDQPVIDLRLTTATFPVANSASLGLPSDVKVLCYNGALVAPTIRVHRGVKVRLHLKNDLFKTNNPPQGDPTKPLATDGRSEEPGLFGTTNLHTHGLHVNPADPGDNVFLCIKPGQEHTFHFDIPTDHPSGTFWYHPHHHHSVAYQLANGLAGALIVEGSPNDGYNDLDKIPQIAAAKQHMFVFQVYNLRVQIEANGDPLPNKAAWVDADTIYKVRIKEVRCDAIKVAADDEDPKKTKAFQASAINGVFNPTLTIRPGELQRWRLINAAWDLNRQLSLVNDADQSVEESQFYEIALDGLATGKLDKTPSVSIAPGQRSDVLFKAPLLNSGENERVYHLKQAGVAANQAPHEAAQAPNWLARIVVKGAPKDMPLPDPNDVAKCRPFQPIADGELVAKNKAFTFSVGGGFTINGTTFNYQPWVKLGVKTAEEWTITANPGSHPFHLHVNPFEIVQHTTASGVVTKVDDWRDTLFITNGDSYKIRIRFRDFPGKSVFHCHLLDHEDQGMMMPIELAIPSQPLPPQVICEDMREMKKVTQILERRATATPLLQLRDTQGSPFELTRFRGKPIVLVFFRGIECSHCAAQLRDLVGKARGAGDTELVAVSSEAISNGSTALKALQVTPSDRFHLLVDEQRSAFKKFGCYSDEDPLHGLFVIDRTGTTRAAYVGDNPFGDAKEVIRIVREVCDMRQTAASN
jgi:FtsP/CotA-like multicopper oxidase with cupredoxin domain/peroxiredoxin